MDRIQPPPNYYGAPYPSSGDQGYRPPFQEIYPPQGSQATYPRADNNGNNNSGWNNNNGMNNNSMGGNSDTANNNNGYSFNTDISHPFFGRNIKVYCSFPDSGKWHDVVFEGVMVEQSNDHIVIEDRNSGKSYLIVAVYVNYLELDGVMNRR